MSINLKLLLLLVTSEGIVGGHKLNLFFFRKSLSLPLIKVGDNRSDLVEALETFKYF